MTDELFENFNTKENNEQTETTPEASFASEPTAEPITAAQNETVPELKEDTPVTPDPVYTDIDADSASYRAADQTTEPVASVQPAQQPEQPEQAYVNPYRQPVSEPKTETPSYQDGFYHQSFRSQTDGSHINYTRPVQPTAQQQPYGTGIPSQPQQRYPYNAPTQQHTQRERKKNGISKGAVAIILVICVLVSGAVGFGGSMLASALNQQKYASSDGSTMVIHKVDTEAQVAGTEALVDKTTEEITTQVADTVVEITTEVMQTNSFYGQYIAQGAGSGVIISADGYILTNNHVIDGASSIKVSTRNGESYDAKLVGTDSKVDIALLKVEATNLPTAVFGDSSTLKVGSKAVIIGNPLGTLGGSVTEGIVSALDRSIVIDGKTMHLMQTDAAINPGNSGGGMFNGQGELTGIVVAKSSSSSSSGGTIDNIGFVIPINSVLDILGDLKDSGYVRGRADTGMTFIDLTNQMYAYYYYGNNSAGVYISSVESGSNAEKAGFRQGDRVVSVDGKEIKSADEITEIISEKKAGDTVTFELNRGGSSGKLELTLEEDVPEAKTNTSSNNNSGGNGFSDNNDPFGNSDPFGGFFGR
ncbi:trypsin-like peptidase domain-containing protein [Ruminococcus sp.]|uniref:S1C family serine protease n=1 Tax=Ruminococcus sp. TaxID=41978 RepID=UPI00388D9553